jgi:YidC/Oxa1 family membrane protein insertase
MLLYFMPAMFTVFMLFLPAGLGVYMFTNGLLGIGQQQIVEWHVRRTTGRGRSGEPTGKKAEPDGKTKEESSDASRGSKKGKAGDPDDKAELSQGRPLLGKGKA